MEFPQGKRVQRPAGTDPSWYGKALIQLRREAAGDIELHIEVRDEDDVVGHLDQISAVLGRAYVIRLAEGHRIDCQDIEAVTLLNDSGA